MNFCARQEKVQSAILVEIHCEDVPKVRSHQDRRLESAIPVPCCNTRAGVVPNSKVWFAVQIEIGHSPESARDTEGDWRLKCPIAIAEQQEIPTARSD